MIVTCRRAAAALVLLGIFSLITAGCTSSSTTPGSDNPGTKGAKSPDGPDGFVARDDQSGKKNQPGKKDVPVVKEDHSGWWCDEHGLPEEVCDLCHKKYREEEKKKGNWCEHDRVKTSCFKCNPGLQEKHAREYVKRFGKEPPKVEQDEDTPKKEDPKKSKVEQPNKADPPTKTVKVDHGGWWCNEHGVPEEICARCSAKLATEFKKKNDWCKEHDRPESQCFVCHPELKAKFAKQFETKYGQKPPEPEPEEPTKDGKK